MAEEPTRTSGPDDEPEAAAGPHGGAEHDTPSDPTDASDEGARDSTMEAPSDQKLRKQARRGSLFVSAGYLASYGLRFVSSTVLRGLLFPEAFGVMTLIDGVNIGLLMLSDVGIMQAVIQNKRGDEPIFLNTAWTIHVVRGILLWFLALAVAWPVSLLAPSDLQMQVALMIPISSLGVVAMGFHTTAEFTLRRRVQLGRVVVMEVTSQACAITTSITWAFLDPSIWALVAGGLVNAGMRLAWSYYLATQVGYFNRFAWDKKVRKQIWDFGKWIFGSSAVFYASTWVDKLMVVNFLGAATGGVYATGVLIAEAGGGLVDKIIHSVFYPLFARVGRESMERLRTVYYQTRLRFDGLFMTGIGGLMVLGPWVCGLLFDTRYADAGWILRLLCVRSATLAVVSPAETCLTSLGHSRYGFYQNLVRALWVLIGVPIGYFTGGLVGIVWVAALSGIPPALTIWPKLHELKILRLERELLAWVFFGVGAALGYGVLLVLPGAQATRAWIGALL